MKRVEPTSPAEVAPKPDPTEVAPKPDAFRAVAEEHRAGVHKIREKNRLRRLRFVALLALPVALYFGRRAIDGNPIGLGLPNLGPDAVIILLPILLIVVIGLMMLMPLAQGKSPHIRYSPDQLDVRFDDVRGVDVVLEEVTRTLQIFLTYKEFREVLGGNPRRGILFEGKPGTGKTHLAKAMSSEAGVPFFFVSAPAFQSMFFGMTAFKIRSFFKELKKAARKEGGAIGFIEEIDAVGGRRGGGEQMTGSGRSPMTSWRMGSTDAGSMVNELLIQLQSFDTPAFWGRMKNRFIDLVNLFRSAGSQVKKKPAPYSNILIIGATNRADSLDPALMRPGRFDRTLYFDLPGLAGRRDLIGYFLDKRKHASELDGPELRDELASMTLGYTPAMLEHILDEALVWAIRDGRKELSWRDTQRARLSEEIGLANPVSYSKRERNLIATHEAGHAVAAYMSESKRKLEVLSIIKRREALGLLAHSDTEEKFTRTKTELESTIKIAFGGMCAEQIFFGESGTGPSSDLSAATGIAAQMVGSFGMGSTLVSYEAVHNGAHSSPNIVAKVLSNEDTKREVEELLKRHKDQVTYILEQNRDIVEALRDALLEHEELLGDEIMTVIEQALARRKSI